VSEELIDELRKLENPISFEGNLVKFIKELMQEADDLNLEVIEEIIVSLIENSGDELEVSDELRERLRGKHESVKGKIEAERCIRALRDKAALLPEDSTFDEYIDYICVLDDTEI
jgi:hypothetical protein